MKSHGCRWNGEVRCWSVILEEAALPGEEDYLRREVCGGQQVELRCNKLTARMYALPLIPRTRRPNAPVHKAS
ncbi:MAG: hypothetical protein WBX25_29735 [Rhodomicrobium sp.]